MARRHEIPTHLNVEDRAILGLTVRQISYLVVGCAGAYSLWTQWPDWPDVVRLTMAGACLLAATVVALVRPAGRGLEQWVFVALHYSATPKRGAWRVREPDPAAWRPREVAWAEIAPRVAWTEERP